MEERHRNSGVLIAAILLLAALPLGYFLSVGPAAAYYDQREPPAVVEMIYTPLFWLAERSEVIRDLFEWYVELWVD